MIKSLFRFIGRANTLIILTLFYLAIIGPISLVIRSIQLFKKERKKQNTFWLIKEGTSKLEHQF